MNFRHLLLYLKSGMMNISSENITAIMNGKNNAGRDWGNLDSSPMMR